MGESIRPSPEMLLSHTHQRIFIFQFFLTFIFKISPLVFNFIFIFNPFDRVNAYGATKSHCHATCAGAARSAMLVDDFHVNLCHATPIGVTILFCRDSTLEK